MNIISIVVIALLIAATLWWVLKPLWEGGSKTLERGAPLQQQTLAELEQRRNAIYTAIKDLELDFESNKISEDDYRQSRLRFTQQAAGILKQIDHLSQDMDARLDEEIDALLARFQADSPEKDENLQELARAEIKREAAAPSSTCPNCQQPVNPDDAFCHHCGASLTGLCPNCQNVAAPGDIFCTRCGTRLVAEVTE
jgi:cell division protein FtsB